MKGYVKSDSAGNSEWVPYECEYCQMDSAGNHQFNCPYSLGEKRLEVKKDER